MKAIIKRVVKAGLFLGFFSALALFGTTVYADKLLIEAVSNEPPNSLEGIPRPNPGMLSQRVKDVFGAPISVSEAIGNPPIIRWQYKKFEVVFEGEYVINTVLKNPIEMLVNDE